MPSLGSRGPISILPHAKLNYAWLLLSASPCSIFLSPSLPSLPSRRPSQTYWCWESVFVTSCFEASRLQRFGRQKEKASHHYSFNLHSPCLPSLDWQGDFRELARRKKRRSWLAFRRPRAKRDGVIEQFMIRSLVRQCASVGRQIEWIVDNPVWYTPPPTGRIIIVVICGHDSLPAVRMLLSHLCCFYLFSCIKNIKFAA